MLSGQREFAALLASFLDLRLPTTDAVAYTGDALGDRSMARACRRLNERLRTGQTLSNCLRQSIHFDRTLVALVAWGIGLGLVAALALTRIFARSFHKLGELDAVTCVTVCAVLGGFALLAGYLPARKALRVDPVQALRCE